MRPSVLCPRGVSILVNLAQVDPVRQQKREILVRRQWTRLILIYISAAGRCFFFSFFILLSPSYSIILVLFSCAVCYIYTRSGLWTSASKGKRAEEGLLPEKSLKYARQYSERKERVGLARSGWIYTKEIGGFSATYCPLNSLSLSYPSGYLQHASGSAKDLSLLAQGLLACLCIYTSYTTPPCAGWGAENGGRAAPMG